MSGRSAQHGFTLIELIITLMILGILGAAAGHALTGGALAYSGNADNLQTLGKLRYASERMVRELREIRRSSLNPAIYDITTMTATTLVFIRRDGTAVTLNAAPPLLTLAYSVPAGTYTLTDEVGSLALSYFKADGTTPATGNADVAYIVFDLVLASNGKSFPQQARVALRNRQ